MMEENQGRRPGTAEPREDDHAYELDLDEHSPGALEDAFQDAVNAVERDGPEERDPGAESVSRSIEVEAEGTVNENPRQDVEVVEAEEDETFRERWLRTLADFENYRKRTEREKKSIRRMGIFEVVKDFLEVIDNLERALESSGNVEDLKQGLRMILRQQEEILKRHGVRRVESVGEPFDPFLHQAVTKQETVEVTAPTVTDELQSGYLLYDRLLRPAMVRVAMPAAASQDARFADRDTAESGDQQTAEEKNEGEFESVAD